MKKVFTTRNFCIAYALITTIVGVYACITKHAFYWHIFLIAWICYNIATIEGKNGDK